MHPLKVLKFDRNSMFFFLWFSNSFCIDIVFKVFLASHVARICTKNCIFGYFRWFYSPQNYMKKIWSEISKLEIYTSGDPCVDISKIDNFTMRYQQQIKIQIFYKGVPLWFFNNVFTDNPPCFFRKVVEGGVICRELNWCVLQNLLSLPKN